MKKVLSAIGLAITLVVTALAILAITSTLNVTLKIGVLAAGVLGASLGFIAVLSLIRQLQSLQSQSRRQADTLAKLDSEVQHMHALVKRVESLEAADENASRQQTKLFDLILNKNV